MASAAASAMVQAALRALAPPAGRRPFPRHPSAVFDAMRHIKPRLLAHGGVANPRDSYGYRCGLRLALHQNASFLFVLPSIEHCTRRHRRLLGALSLTFPEILHMTKKIKCALIGPGNIGTDLLAKLQRSAV
ncbi:MAG: hypothetical protein WAX63_05500, partial [Rhodoferax sp.]